MSSKKRPQAKQDARGTVRGTTDFSADDELRGELAVVVSLVRRKDGTVRVVFDDARRGRNGTWTPNGIITSRDYPAEIVDDLAVLDRKELEDTGLAVLARLTALEVVARSGA